MVSPLVPIVSGNTRAQPDQTAQGILSGRAAHQQFRQGEQAIKLGEQVGRQREQEISRGQYDQGVARAGVLVRLAKEVKQLPMEQRQAYVDNINPKTFSSLGITPEQIAAQGLDDQSLDGVISQLSTALPQQETGPDLGSLHSALPKEHQASFRAIASADPKKAIEFANSVLKPRSNGITVSPDGTVQIGGPRALDKSNARKVEENIINSGATLSRLKRIKETYDPEFLTFQGRVKNKVSSLKDKGGVNLTAEEKGALRQRRQFTQNVNSEFNAYKKLITGAAASIQEVEGIKKAIISDDLSPTEFEAAFDEYSAEVARSIRVRNKVLRQGLSPGTKDFGEALDDMFLGGGDDDIESRGSELEAQGMSDQDIVKTLEEEGYLQ